jgi:hypothetical protein
LVSRSCNYAKSIDSFPDLRRGKDPSDKVVFNRFDLDQ